MDSARLRDMAKGGAVISGNPGERATPKRKRRARLGSGLVTGVADDDPSGIATYAQAGARFGLDMLWTMPVAFPLMAAVQSACARIGRVTGRGLTANLREILHPGLVRALVLVLVLANVCNIGADIAAMGEVGELVTGGSRHAFTLFFVALSLGLQILVPYHRYVTYLKWLTASLLSYVAVIFMVHVPWREVGLSTIWPQLSFDAGTATMIVAIFGTTISPYLFFWQPSEEVEDMEREHALPLANESAAAPAELSRIEWDTWTGMFYSDLSSYFIMLATAVTLHPKGITSIETAAEAAGALRPIAGDFAFALFAAGIVGTGLIGVPVLAGSAAYAVAEAFGWREGLERRLAQARGFYAVIAASLLVGLALTYSPLSPMRALFWSAVLNGVASVPLLASIAIVANSRAIMGAFTPKWTVTAGIWLTCAGMAVASFFMLPLFK